MTADKHACRVNDVPSASPNGPDQVLPGCSAEFAQAVWRKSTRSTFNGNCVEVACLPAGTVGVRDTRDRSGLVLVFGAAAWRSFVTELKAAPPPA